MTALRAKVIEDTAAQVRIVLVGRETAKWWNQRRGPDDTVQFCGWYWVRGNEEAGPFRSRSACIRDAYYAFVLKRERPTIAASVRHEETSRSKKSNTGYSKSGKKSVPGAKRNRLPKGNRVVPNHP